MKNNEKHLGAVSATGVDAVSCSVHADAASHAAPTHTPGPWELRECSHGGMILIRGRVIGENNVHPQSMLQIVPTADAHLIAAAPEMKTALLKVVPLCDALNELMADSEDMRARVMALLIKHGLQDDYGHLVAQAIAKAEGRS